MRSHTDRPTVDLIVDRFDAARIPSAALRSGENPGVGGTQWTTVTLAARLRRSGLVDARLVVVGPDGPPELTGVPTRYVADLGVTTGWDADVIVAAASTAEHLGPSWSDRRVVVVIHHPHDDKRIARIRSRFDVAAFVAVGQYAYWSHRIRDRPYVWIPNPFPSWALRDDASVRRGREGRDGPVLGFVGALLPPKGFHLVAGCWPAIRSALPGARLEVIGSAALYGQAESHDTLPTTEEYGDRILDALGDARDSVTFLGLVREGKARVMSGWDAALLNPTGATEADPASLKEVIAAGVPPIASRDHGMWDLMRGFPGLAVDHPTLLTGTAVRAVTDPRVRANFLEQRHDVMARQLVRDQRLEEAWSDLLRIVLSSAPAGRSVPILQPARPAGRIGWRLLTRTPRFRRTRKRLRRLRRRLFTIGVRPA